jgi:hypothetical protein
MKLFDRFPILVLLGAALLGFAAGELAAGDPFLERFGALPPHFELLAGAAGGVLALALAMLWKAIVERRTPPPGSRVDQPQGPLSRGAAED